MDCIYSLGLSSSLYALYVQFNSKIGNVWIRKDSNNEDVIVLGNLVNMMKQPFFNCDFWKVNTIDMNILAWFVSVYGIVYTIRIIQTYIDTY